MSAILQSLVIVSYMIMSIFVILEMSMLEKSSKTSLRLMLAHIGVFLGVVFFRYLIETFGKTPLASGAWTAWMVSTSTASVLIVTAVIGYGLKRYRTSQTAK